MLTQHESTTTTRGDHFWPSVNVLPFTRRLEMIGLLKQLFRMLAGIWNTFDNDTKLRIIEVAVESMRDVFVAFYRAHKGG